MALRNRSFFKVGKGLTTACAFGWGLRSAVAKAMAGQAAYGWKGLRRRVLFWFGTSTASQSKK